MADIVERLGLVASDIRCDNELCECGVRDFNREADAIAAWNRRAEPTPETLEAWAEWFDDPNKSPAIVMGFYTTGYLLREIARRMRAADPTGPR